MVREATNYYTFVIDMLLFLLLLFGLRSTLYGLSMAFQRALTLDISYER